MTKEEAVRYIEGRGWAKTHRGLDRMRKLMRALGDPQNTLKFIHIAGTNGKGSTAAMLSSILTRAGYRTGLYISPHLMRINERISVDGEEIPDDVFIELTERVALYADRMAERPSVFEILTAIGFLYFAYKKCDIVVLEVGMGGDYDATNVIEPPIVSVITNIGLDHTMYLGDTIAKIALTKSGIIKEGSRAVSFDLPKEAMDVVRDVCREKKVPLRKADFRRLRSISSTLDRPSRQEFSYKRERYFLTLLGRYQLRNAAVVLETIDLLREEGWDIPREAIESGLLFVRWPARFEVLNRKPLIILDGGHNEQCARALVECIDELLSGYTITFAVGMLKDKDFKQTVEILSHRAWRFVALTPDSERALPARELKACMLDLDFPTEAFESVPEGLNFAVKELEADEKMGLGPTAIIIFGSLYLAGQVEAEFERKEHHGFFVE